MKMNLSKRLLSAILCIALIVTYLPLVTLADTVVTRPNGTVVATDSGTADAWESILGTYADGTRYAGRVWVDKSVYKDGDTVNLGGADGSFVVDVDEANGEYFQLVFSALGSSMSTNTISYTIRPLDVVLVLDTSTSMTTSSSGKTRLTHMIEAANSLLTELLALGDVRVAIVSFNRDSETVIDLAKYENGIVLSTNDDDNTNGGGIIYAHDKNNNLLGNDSGYTMGTNLQSGIDRGMNILANAENTAGRAPVAIVLADGRANRAVNDDWYSPTSSGVSSSDDAGIMLSTLLNAAYGRTRVEKNYDADMTVYGVGIDLSSTSNDYIFLNPGAAGSSGFNASNTDDAVKDAWDAFSTWKTGNTATMTFGSRNQRTWVFDHNWPASAGVTTAEVAANINYVDKYQNVTGATLGEAFDEILQELSVGAFNPISTTINGATGVEDTPLIYVDNIGQYMEVKDIQRLEVFGQTFAITKDSAGTYSVAAGSGMNPTTNETWNTASSIEINVLQNADGTQQLRVYIDQEILPILLEEIAVTTEGNVTTRTIEETGYSPLRIYYTVGVSSDILLPNGTVNLAKLDSSYAYINSDDTVSFYSNTFGQMNIINPDGDAFVDEGDAHVGFIPSHNNRYYYHQAHQEIFISATDKNGNEISWDDDMYGVLWDEDLYNLKAMTYGDLASISDSDTVYTYVTFTRPIGTGNEAEEVTYLVYSSWGEMKSAATYYDKVNKTFLNDGAIDGDVDSVVSSYLNGKTNVANSDLIAVLGLQSRRVSRLHHMFETKAENVTGTAETSYAPEYNDHAHESGDIHEHSEVIVWLGNNGKLTVPVSAGIQVTKHVTEVADGAAANEAFNIHVLLDMAYTTEAVESLFVADANGDALSSQYAVSNADNKVLVTLSLADGESAVILGVPGDVDYTVTEAEHEKYTASYNGATRTVAGEIVEGTVTNTPIQLGSLYITKEVEHAVVGEAFPTDYEFEFRVAFKDKNGAPIVDTFQLENNYDASITSRATDENGVMTGWLRHGETVHILGIPDGATVTVEEVNLPTDGNYTLKSYRSRNHSGEDADNDGVVTVTSGQNATVVVTNTYTPKATSAALDLTIVKTLRVDIQPTEDRYFTFALEKWNGTGWTPVKDYSGIGWPASEVKVGEDNVQTYHDQAASDLGLFTKAGTYIYQISEVIPTTTDRIPGMTYDRTIHTITVTVTDVNGQLVAVARDEHDNVITDTDSDGDLDFTASFLNVENAATVSIDIEKRINDLSNNPLTSYAGFEFVAQTAEVDSNGNWSVKPDGRSFSVYSDGVGHARMVDVYRDANTYYYIISEKNQGKNGWNYSSVQYRVTVVVTDDGTGNLTAQMTIAAVNGATDEIAAVTDNTKGKIIFENTYDPADAEVAVDTLVKKELNNGKPGDKEFTFAIFENGKASHTSTAQALMIGTSDADGNVVFTATQYGISQGFAKVKTVGGQEVTVLNFSQVGDYPFDVVEITGNLPGVTYDSIIYDLVVEVTDNGDGTLKANYYFEDSVNTTVVFENTYAVEPVSVVIDGIKTLKVNNGKKSIYAGDYTFHLYDAAGNKIGETTNLADGTFKFDAIEYHFNDVGQTYTYTVKEVAPDDTTDGSYSEDGVTWSGQSFTVTVAISDNGDGTLSAVVTGNGSQNIFFENVYSTNPANVKLPGKKVLNNRPLTAGEFEFALYSADRTFTTLTPVNENITHGGNGDFDVALGELAEGRHYFVVKENIPAEHAKGIHYSAAEFHITVVVTDHGTGQMGYTTTVVNPAVPNVTDAAILFTNVYIPEPGELPLSGSKTYKGGKTLQDDVFSVGLYDSENNLLQTAFVKADGRFVFENLRYHADDVGQTYTYTIKEILPDGATDNGNGTFAYGKDIYDGSVYTLTVAITDDNKDGELEISQTLTKGGAAANALTFTNTFVPDATGYVIKAKKTYKKGLNGGDFEFRLVSLDDKTDVDQTKENAANGDIIFDSISFAEAGEYKFKLTEKKDGILSFIRPSQAEYEITITVVNENGVLRVSDVTNVNTKNTGETNLEFINTYVMDGEAEVTLRGTKILRGDRTRVNSGEFSFALFGADGKLIEIVQNDANGNFAFSTLTFDETDVQAGGQISYIVREIAGSNACITYDGSKFEIVVSVKDNDAGGVEASYTVNGIENGAISFVNYYADPDPASYAPVAKKLYNKKLNGGEFKFKLEGRIDGVSVSQEKTNAADGTITFDALQFSEAGAYTFKVTEIEKALGFIQYSAAEYELVVNVIEVQGELRIGAVTVNNDPNGTLAFTNTYVMDGEDEITLRGQKLLVGGRTSVEAGEFTFGLYDAEGKLIESVKNDADGKFVFATLKFDETDVPVDGQKQITYTVKEIEGSDIRMTYDKTVYTVVVTVKDNDQGGVSASYTVNGKADGALVFTNVYTPKPGDLSVDFRVVKTVVNKGSEKITPADFRFLLKADGVADVVVKSDENGNAKFTLSFTEADVGKTYTYKLSEVNDGKANVSYSAAEYTVTVTVSLNESNQLVAAITQNGETVTEVVAEFENVYDYTPAAEQPDNPQTGDNTNLYLWIVLLVISGGGIIGTVLCIGKKKEEKEE